MWCWEVDIRVIGWQCFRILAENELLIFKYALEKNLLYMLINLNTRNHKICEFKFVI
jgi:hypothetical protein